MNELLILLSTAGYLSNKKNEFEIVILSNSPPRWIMMVPMDNYRIKI
jgi:hypothetical protein